MPKVIYITPDGTNHEFEVENGYSVMEGAINIVNCLDCNSKCERSDDCRTRSVWERASRAMEQELDSITLAELIETPEGCPSMD